VTDTVAAVLAAAEDTLLRARVPSPAVDARLLVRHATGWSAAELTLRRGDPLDAATLREIDRLVVARAARTPLQLLLGTVGFRRVDLEVRAGVFIPRPETELLVEHALSLLPPGGLAVEPCTGSGAVAAALADERSDVRVVATDVDPAAVALARRNTAWVGDRVRVLVGDLLEPLDPGLRGGVDVIVSNPPYLADAELDGLEPEVRAGDPPSALSAGPTGHEVSDRIVAAAASWLVPGGWLVLELDPSRAHEVARRCRDTNLEQVVVADDLVGRPRYVRARRGERSTHGGSTPL
jgi:release factor glutamine methyltransferase